MARLQRHNSNGDNASNPKFWNPSMLNMGETAKAVIAPWVSPLTKNFYEIHHTLRFTFVDPDTGDDMILSIPSRRNFGAYRSPEWECPATEELSTLFRGASELRESGDTAGGDELHQIARSMWGFKQYVMQGFLLDHREIPTDRLVILNVSPSVGSSLTSTVNDYDELPTGQFALEDIPHYFDGTLPADVRDQDEFESFFRCRPYIFDKRRKGEYADYSASRWAGSETMFSDDQLRFLEDHGYYDTESVLGNNRMTYEQSEFIATEIIPYIVEADTTGEVRVWDESWTDALGGMRPRAINSDNAQPVRKSSALAAFERIRNGGSNRRNDDADNESARPARVRTSEATRNSDAGSHAEDDEAPSRSVSRGREQRRLNDTPRSAAKRDKSLQDDADFINGEDTNSDGGENPSVDSIRARIRSRARA